MARIRGRAATSSGQGIMTTLQETDRLWDARDVARYLNVSRSWVYQHAEDGTLPSLHIGAMLRFDPEAIRTFAHKQGR